MPIWIGSPTEVFDGEEAKTRLASINDSKYNTLRGVIKVDVERWQQAQQFESTTWKNLPYATSDRVEEHMANFHEYEKAHIFGNVLEVGCGPFTQLNYILDSKAKIGPIDDILLLDPLIDEYLLHPACPYKSYYLRGYPVRFMGIPVEQLNTKVDTIICINVLEHVFDAELAIACMLNALRSGGTLIFSERVYDDFNPMELYDVGHPIRITSPLVDNIYESLSGATTYMYGGGPYASKEYCIIGTRI